MHAALRLASCGMNYRATRGEDGTLTVHRVPIFVECKRGEVDYDREWLTVAVQKAKAAEVDGYMPPLHVRHHDYSAGDAHDPARPAGYFRITGLGTISIKGKTRAAVFADLVVTDPMVGEDIVRKRLPYRSVEIADVEAPGFSSLALLDHEAPFHELPMLFISDVQTDAGLQPPLLTSVSFANPMLREHADSEDTVVACFRRGKSAHLIFEEPEAMTVKTDDADAKKKTDKAKAKTDDRQAKLFAEGDDDSGGDGDDSGEGDEMKAEPMDVGAICKAIKDGSISVADMAEIMAAIEEAKAATATADEETKDTAASVQVPGQAMKQQAFDEKFAALAGENKALKSRLDERDALDKREKDVAEALKRLEDKPLGSKLEEELTAFHKEHGPGAFKAYVDKMVSTFASMSGRGSKDAPVKFDASDTPSEALAYMEQGTEAMARAAKFSAEYEELAKRGARYSRESYIRTNMRHLGFKDPAKKQAS